MNIWARWSQRRCGIRQRNCGGNHRCRDCSLYAIYNGVDWGFYPDPWAFNRMHYDAARRTLYIFGELTRHRTGNAETARLLRQYGVQDTDLITADSAEPKSVADYRCYGLFCVAQ